MESHEEKILIKELRKTEGWGVKKLMSEFRGRKKMQYEMPGTWCQFDLFGLLLNQWSQRLQKVIEVRGGHIKQYFEKLGIELEG